MRTRLLFPIVAVALCGCGVILNGTRQNIPVNSSPAGTAVTVSSAGGQNGARYTTPTDISLERKNSYVLTFSREGYTSATFQINNSMQAGIVVADVFLTGLVGVIVDAATGAWYRLSPESATVTLTRTTARREDGSPAADSIAVVVGQPERGHLAISADERVTVEVQVIRRRR